MKSVSNASTKVMNNVVFMVSYKKLWHILIDRGMRKNDLLSQAKLTPHIMLKLRNNMHINTSVIEKICRALNCSAEDFIDFIEMEDNTNEVDSKAL